MGAGAHPALNTAFEDVRGVREGGASRGGVPDADSRREDRVLKYVLD